MFLLSKDVIMEAGLKFLARRIEDSIALRERMEPILYDANDRPIYRVGIQHGETITVKRPGQAGK